MQLKRRRDSALGALTSSALALPGLAGKAAADTPSGRFAADYSFSYYLEDDLPRSKVSPGGETDRYEISMHQLHLASPISERIDLGLDVVHEIMSGATPWYVIPDEDGDPVQVMTGATIEDRRTDALLSGSYYFDSGRAGLSTRVSIEDDYLALGGGVEGERHFNEKNTTLSGGLGVSVDRLEPTDADDFPLRPDHEDRQSYSVFAGISQIVSREGALQTSLAYEHARGFLSDPYKQVLVAGNPMADSRPSARNQASWLTRYRHHFPQLDGTVHADYRLYVDDWEVTSHTLEVAWYQTLWHTLRLIPSFRYYSQSQAEFYAPFFDGLRSDDHYTSDYRLSPYGALSWRLRAETRFQTWQVDWRAAISWQRYLSSGDYALGKVEQENPGLVSFHLFSISLKASF